MNAAPRKQIPDVQDSDLISGQDIDIDVSIFARLGFGRGRDDAGKQSQGARHLALLPADTLELDLSDPAQRQFGEYELLEQIGEGGMGVVYRARQIALDREVAIKLLAAGVWASKEFVERFRREAQNAARMQHPNIVPVYEVGENDELHFFSMRLIQGGSLAAELKRDGKIAPLRAAQLLRIVAEAVDYAHRLGVLHLDLKPANVLIDENGTPHVADFGLARRLDSALAADNDEVSGTPSYMAPEQASPRTQRITPATDIWGLGAILYELTTGEPPFLGKSPQATLQMVVDGTLQAPRRHAPTLPRDLEAIILKSMTYRADERYASARALADDLTRYIEGRAVRARPLSAIQRTVRWARREPKLALAVGLAAAALLTGIATTSLQWRRAESGAAETRATLWQARHIAAEVAIAGDDGFAAIRPILANLAEQEQQDVDASAERLRIGLELEYAPRLIDVLPLDAVPLDLAVSPDRRRVAILTDAGPATKASVSLLDPLAARVLWTTPVAPSEVVRFQSDGRAVQVDNKPPDGGGYHWERLSIEDGAPVPLTVPGVWTRNTYSMDGHYGLLGDDHDQVQLWDLQTGKALSALRAWPMPALSADPFNDGTVLWGGVDNATDARLVAPEWKPLWRLAPSANETVHISDWSPDQRWLMVGMESGRIDLVDLTSGAQRSLPNDFGNRVGHLAFSPDSQWLVVGSLDHGAKIWSTADAKLLALPIQHAGMVTTLAVDAAARLLMSNDDGTPRLWRLANAPSRYAPVVPTGPRLSAHSATYNVQPLLLLPELDLAITGGIEKELRFWRLPPNPLRHTHAAPVADADLIFDGKHLLAVDGNQVQVVDAWAERALTPPLTHAQPVSHAALSRDGKTVWVTAGDEVHRWDWAQGQARAAAVKLPNVVQHMALNPHRDEVIVSVLRYESGRVYEDLLRIDSEQNQVLATCRLAGPLGNLRYSDDGAQLLAWRGQTLYRLDATTLLPAWPVLRMDSGKGAGYLDARAHDNALWTSVINPYTDSQRTALWHYDSGTTSPNWREPAFLGLLVAALRDDGTQAVISPGGYPGHMPIQRFGARGDRITLGERGYGGMAADFSPDSRWLATALPDGIRLYSDANPVGPPLRAALDYHDRVEQVAFAVDGSSVLARSTKGHWLLWRVHADTRPIADIADELDTVLATSSDGNAPMHFDAALRSRLRARDAGASSSASASWSDATRTDPNVVPPPRAPDTPANLLDLSAYLTRTAHEQNASDSSFDVRRLALGRQRIDGVEFDLRGVVHLSAPLHEPTQTPLPRQVRGIAVPEQASAFQLLMGDYGDGNPSPCLSLILHFTDGGERRVPISLSVPWLKPEPLVDPLLGEATTAPLVLQVQSNNTEYATTDPLRLYRVRVENPEPRRSLASLGLYAERNAPYVAAITTETTVAAPQ
ncbi:MAG: WD40 repeat domain-containing serine/threonine-protein kinase [Rudaea sp.]